MKKLKAILFGLLFSACYLSSGAQEKTFNEPDHSKPQLFADLPQKLNLKTSSIDVLWNLSVGAAFTIQIADGLSLSGTVTSKSDDASFHSVVVKLTNRQGAVLSISKISNADGSFTLRGRILSRNHSDALELAKENGQYVFQKKNYYELVSE